MVRTGLFSPKFSLSSNNFLWIDFCWPDDVIEGGNTTPRVRWRYIFLVVDWIGFFYDTLLISNEVQQPITLIITIQIPVESNFPLIQIQMLQMFAHYTTAVQNMLRYYDQKWNFHRIYLWWKKIVCEMKPCTVTMGIIGKGIWYACHALNMVFLSFWYASYSSIIQWSTNKLAHVYVSPFMSHVSFPIYMI